MAAAGFLFITIHSLYNYLSKSDFRLKRPPLKNKKEIYEDFINQKLVYSHKTWLGFFRCESPRPLEEVYSRVLEYEPSLRKKHIVQFLFNPDYSDLDFMSLMDKIERCYKDSRSWENKRSYSLEEYLVLITTSFIFRKINKIFLIKENEEFNTFLETGKIT